MVHPWGVIWGPYFPPPLNIFENKSAECSVHLYSSPCLIEFWPYHLQKYSWCNQVQTEDPNPSYPRKTIGQSICLDFSFVKNFLAWEHSIYIGTVILEHVIYFAEPHWTRLWVILGRATCTVHLISTPDQPGRNGILLSKLFWPTVRKNCSSDREKPLKFEAEGREFAKSLSSLEQFVQKTVKGHNNFW